MSRVDICQIIELPKMGDERGNLSFVESCRHMPFDMKRIYYLYDVPKNMSRGAHAHKVLHQLMIAISGSFDVVLDDGSSNRQFHLNQPNHALYICPMVWRDLDNFSPDAVCLVIASEFYDEHDYIHDYQEFMHLIDRGQ